MDFSAVCRTCLSTKSLNPIFLKQSEHLRYTTAIYTTTGIKVELNDSLPQNMCTKCVNYLNSCLQFRKQCKNVETKLLELHTQLSVTKTYNTINCLTGPNTKLLNHEDLYSEIKTDLTDQKLKHIDFDFLEENDNTPTIDTKKEYIDKPLDITLEELKPAIHLSKEQYFDEPLMDEEKQESSSVTKQDINKDEYTESECIVKELSQKTYVERSTGKESNSLLYGEVMEIYRNVIDVNDSGKVTCKLCQKDFSARWIEQHITRRHPGIDYRRVKCELCDAVILRHKIEKHMSVMHSHGTFKCRNCHSEFRSRAALVEHISSCKRKNQRKTCGSAREITECDVCHKRMQKASIRMHKAVKHAGLRPVCEHCGKSFGNKFRLNEHYRAKHDYEKFKCPECDFQSAGAMAMRNHQRRHRGEKPFACNTCDAKFHAAYLLAQHKQSHRTEKLIKCDLCPATFKANNSLHMHKITCHSAYMYKCSMCPREYKCRHYAVKHLRSVHNYSGPVSSLQRLPAEK